MGFGKCLVGLIGLDICVIRGPTCLYEEYWGYM